MEADCAVHSNLRLEPTNSISQSDMVEAFAGAMQTSAKGLLAPSHTLKDLKSGLRFVEHVEMQSGNFGC